LFFAGINILVEVAAEIYLRLSPPLPMIRPVNLSGTSTVRSGVPNIDLSPI
jgi:hypothetical protein